MEQQIVHKTFKYQLTPTPAQEQALATVLRRCRALFNVALEQRKTWWQLRQGKRASYYQQKAELPGLTGLCPDFAGVNAQVLQDVILRVERACFVYLQVACLRRGFQERTHRYSAGGSAFGIVGGGRVVRGGTRSTARGSVEGVRCACAAADARERR